MPENTINPRKCIHEARDSKTSHLEDSSEEDELIDNGREGYKTESGSDFEDDKTYKYRFEISRSPTRTPVLQKARIVNAPFQQESRKQSLPIKAEKSGLFKYSYVLVFVTLSAVAVAVFYHRLTNEPKLNCSFEKLSSHYEQENEKLWRTLKVGIESILHDRNQKPVVYLFTHLGGDHVSQLIKDIAEHSSNCFGKEMSPVEMKSDDFILPPGIEDDYGFAIEKYKSKIKDGHVLLIANLNDIPPRTARALHTICDTYSPIAKDVIIFLTLIISPTKEERSANARAEDTLRELWGSTLARNELDPLITRVTDQVIALQS